MSKVKKILESFQREVEKKKGKAVFTFEEYLELVRANPQENLRNIFQVFRDMIKHYVKEGKSEYPEDPEEIPFMEYDCSKLFEEGVENPFFADRLFANRFIREVELITLGSQQNQVFVFEGSHGCGKSTFLNNLLQKFQEYTETEEGRSFEIFWKIDPASFPENEENKKAFKKIEVPCPSHDYPILIIPQKHRREFLDKLLPDSEIKRKIFGQKEYEWIFKREACTICSSLFWILFEKLGSLDKVMEMIRVRPIRFNRRLGQGIVVFNPGDKSPIEKKALFLTNQKIQDLLDEIFGPSKIKYVYSLLSKTNNGIYVLMDVKGKNKKRLFNLHNVISEGVWRAGEIEERIHSLFLALMNPEDKEALENEKKEGFCQGRLRYIKIPFVLNPKVEVKIYRTIFGKKIDSYFLPEVLENFARIIVSSRMNLDCPPLKEWIEDIEKYEKYCDKSGLLLRMEIYSNDIPPWLSEEDKKKLTSSMKRKLLSLAEKEGEKGISGRDSIKLFRDFFALLKTNSKLITMENVADFFKKVNEGLEEKIPENFINSAVDWYDYKVLGQVKEALYFFNKKRISEDILHYLTAINYDLDTKVKCRWTGKEIEVTMDFLKEIGARITGEELDDEAALTYAQEIQRKYAQVVAKGEEKEITETKLYKELFNSYGRNLKEKALEPFVQSKSFRQAVKAYGTKEFETFDKRIKEHVAFMIRNLVKKFGYTQKGAKEVCLYVIDKKLWEKF